VRRGDVLKLIAGKWPRPHLQWISSSLLRFTPTLSSRPTPAYAANAWSLESPMGAHHITSDGDTDARGRETPGLKFQVLSVSTVAFIFGLVTLGGVVRLTGSGLGCPDWPLCYGQVIPPFEYHALIEYSHRMLASVAGVMVISLAVIVWRRHRKQAWLMIPATAGIILLATQVMLGGATVMKELPSALVLAHLAVAEALMACMVAISVVSIGSPVRLPKLWSGEGLSDKLPLLTLTAAALAYGLLLTGSYVTVSGATVSCGEFWPLCQGQLIPDGSYAWLHMSHRIVAGIVGALVILVVVLAWRRSSFQDPLKWVALAAGLLFLIQVGLGASIVTSGFTMATRLSHLSVATLMWVSLAVLALVVLRGGAAPLKDGGRA